MPHQIANDLGIDPLDGRKLSRPVVAKMRPGEPGGFMRLPLGRHAVSGRTGENRLTRASGHFPSVILRRSFFVNHAAGDGSVGVDAAIAEEGPIAANLFQMAQVNFADQDFLFVMRCFCQNSTERIAEERSSPELESLAGSRIAADV